MLRDGHGAGVDTRFDECLLGRLQRRSRLFHAQRRDIPLFLGDHAALGEFAAAFGFIARQRVVGFFFPHFRGLAAHQLLECRHVLHGAGELALGTRQPVFGCAAVEANQLLALFDIVALLGPQPEHHVVELGSDVEDVPGGIGVIGFHKLAFAKIAAHAVSEGGEHGNHDEQAYRAAHGQYPGSSGEKGMSEE